MEEVRICDYCGMELAEDEELLCDDCVADHCITCDHCGEIIWTADCVTDDNSFLCQSCFDAHYHRCESCDRIIASYRMPNAAGTMIYHIVKAVLKIWKMKSKITATNLHRFSMEMESDISAWNWKWMTEAKTMIMPID